MAKPLLIVPFLSWAQRRTGKAPGSNAVVADSTRTLLCASLFAVLLVDLVMNATLGWSWANLAYRADHRCGGHQKRQ